jgi:NAD(P)-dependent dehydrogenase (short-subunit alcohol dehydrogenase family)
VVITGRRRDVLDGAVQQLQAAGVTAAGLQGDVRSPEACQGWVADTLARFSCLDILVNCAAGNFLANAAELTQGGFKTGEQCSVAVVQPAQLRRASPCLLLLLSRLLVPCVS